MNILRIRIRCGPMILAALLVIAITGYAEEVDVLIDGVSYPEGPAMVGDDLYFVEYGAHRVMRWHQGQLSKFYRWARMSFMGRMNRYAIAWVGTERPCPIDRDWRRHKNWQRVRQRKYFGNSDGLRICRQSKSCDCQPTRLFEFRILETNRKA